MLLLFFFLSGTFLQPTLITKLQYVIDVTLSRLDDASEKAVINLKITGSAQQLVYIGSHSRKCIKFILIFSGIYLLVHYTANMVDCRVFSTSYKRLSYAAVATRAHLDSSRSEFV